MESTQSSAAKNRKTLLIALAVFAIPFAAALLLHKTGLYSEVGTTNRGLLITPPVAFDSITLNDQDQTPLAAEDFKKQWWIVYVLPEQCDAACKNSLFQMRQVHSALGPEQKRVSRLLISTHPIDADVSEFIKTEFPKLNVAYTQQATLNASFANTDNAELNQNQSGKIYLVDTMGAVFMYYPTYADEQESILKGRYMLKDLQKVLKLSKIG